MSKEKILTVVGARPQFMKAAAVSRAISQNESMQEILLHTGQHYDANMSDIIFEQLGLPVPHYRLYAGNCSPNIMISKILFEIDAVIEKENPAMLLVYGDTNSTLAGALAAKKRGVPIAHIEAGVRNYDEDMPEEANRYLTDRISDINFCVTTTGRNNLMAEGYGSGHIASNIFVSGDVMYDLFLKTYAAVKEKPLSFLPVEIRTGPFVLCTIHRASNVDSPNAFNEIVQGINTIHATMPVVLLAHPRTKQILANSNHALQCHVLDPLGYEETLSALATCSYVITDSGGLVREAYFARKKSLLILEKPLWPEIHEAQCSMHVPPKEREIVAGFSALHTLDANFDGAIFGHGDAAEKIVAEINLFLSAKKMRPVTHGH